MKICLATTFFPPAAFGGDAVFVARLAGLLAQGGHEVTVVHAPHAHAALGGEAAGGLARGEAPPGVRVIALEVPGPPKAAALLTHQLGRPVLERRALEAALAGPFDVIHFHNPSLLGGPRALQAGRAALRLMTAHEQWLICPTHVLLKWGREVCERPQCWRCSIAQGRPPQLWRSTGLLAESLRSLDALLVPSATSELLHRRLSREVRIERLPHFVPLEPAGTGAPAAAAGGPYFLYAGRLEPIKGVDLLIEACAQRRDRLLITGAGTQEAELRRAAGRLANVEFLGRVDRAELSRLYAHALAVIVPSRGHESFGLVPVEAFAHGTPAVVRGFGALGEIAAASPAGLAFTSEAELHSILDRLVRDGAWRESLGAEARASAAARWSPEAHLRRYFSLIAELAAGRGARALEQEARSAAG